LKPLLRFAIVLLGAQISFDQILSIGITGVVTVIVTLIATFVFTAVAGALLGVSRDLSLLVAAGTSVCGASAIMATSAVVKSD